MQLRLCAAALAFAVVTAAPAAASDRPRSHALSGPASFYAYPFHGRRTASGERFNMHAMTAAHRTLPFGTRVRVKVRDGRSVEVRINDRGPFVAGRVIDLSRAAASALGIIGTGVAQVQIEIIR